MTRDQDLTTRFARRTTPNADSIVGGINCAGAVDDTPNVGDEFGVGVGKGFDELTTWLGTGVVAAALAPVLAEVFRFPVSLAVVLVHQHNLLALRCNRKSCQPSCRRGRHCNKSRNSNPSRHWTCTHSLPAKVWSKRR